MDLTSGLDGDTTNYPLPPSVVSKSSNMSECETKMTDSRSHQATSGPTLRGRPPYATISGKEAPTERGNVVSAGPGAASSQPSRTRITQHADNQSAAVPAAVSGGSQATAQLGDISRFGVDVNAHSQTNQVSPLGLPPCCSSCSASACNPHHCLSVTAPRLCRQRKKRYITSHIFP